MNLQVTEIICRHCDKVLSPVGSFGDTVLFGSIIGRRILVMHSIFGVFPLNYNAGPKQREITEISYCIVSYSAMIGKPHHSRYLADLGYIINGSQTCGPGCR